ncbi:MAG: hypothetical protein NDI91_03135 [Sulfuritalea sp.]|nr:hypothetical protein [Sulfuritalea sp.]
MMTFRIDEIELEDQGWRLQFKGLDGKGVYARLITKPDGRGLYVVDDGDITLRKPGRQLLDEDEFRISRESTREAAMRCVAAALTRLGWGPEVNNAGKIVAQSVGEQQ